MKRFKRFVGIILVLALVTGTCTGCEGITGENIEKAVSVSSGVIRTTAMIAKITVAMLRGQKVAVNRQGFADWQKNVPEGSNRITDVAEYRNNPDFVSATDREGLNMALRMCESGTYKGVIIEEDLEFGGDDNITDFVEFDNVTIIVAPGKTITLDNVAGYTSLYLVNSELVSDADAIRGKSWKVMMLDSTWKRGGVTYTSKYKLADNPEQARYVRFQAGNLILPPENLLKVTGDLLEINEQVPDVMSYFSEYIVNGEPGDCRIETGWWENGVQYVPKNENYEERLVSQFNRLNWNLKIDYTEDEVVYADKANDFMGMNTSSNVNFGKPIVVTSDIVIDSALNMYPGTSIVLEDGKKLILHNFVGLQGTLDASRGDIEWGKAWIGITAGDGILLYKDLIIHAVANDKYDWQAAAYAPSYNIYMNGDGRLYFQNGFQTTLFISMPEGAKYEDYFVPDFENLYTGAAIVANGEVIFCK